MKLVKVLDVVEAVSAATGRPQLRRAVVLQRAEGYFSVAEGCFYTSEHRGKIIAQGWVQISCEGIFASVELAEAERRSRLLQRYE